MTTYVVQRRGGGFFSIIATVLAHLHLADERGMTPFVDLETLPNPYQESEPVGGTRNVWNYYFQPVTGLDRENLDSGAVEVSSSGFPRGYSDSLVGDPLYSKMWDKYVRTIATTQEFVEHELASLTPDGLTLGVHFRGQEQRIASRHPLPPTIRQMSGAISHVLDNHEFDRIILVTEAKQYVDSLVRRFGKRIIATNTFRLRYRNSYSLKNAPRAQHRYRLGLETFADASILGNCGGFIGCNSNLSDGAALMGRGNHRLSFVLDNGPNSASPIWKHVRWSVSALLPTRFGGFDTWQSITTLRRGAIRY